MSNDIRHTPVQAPAPQPHTPKKKFTEVFRGVLTELKTALNDEMAVETSPQPRPPAAPVPSGETVNVEDVLETSDQMAQGLQHLQGHQQRLGTQIDTILRLDSEEQRRIVKLMWKTIEQMEAALTAVQEAQLRLQRALADKRLVLLSTKQELQKYVDRDTAQRGTITKLRQDNARLTREHREVHHQLASLQEDMERLQQQHATLARQHDELVGTHHQLFQRFLREQRVGKQ
jgi:chromosome segregation ATPase